ncbi:MAG: serine/threonine protein kinase [Planctomycetota bacterium]|jgi:serine/threonine-protein kinase
MAESQQTNNGGAANGTELARVVVEQKLATQEEVDACVQEFAATGPDSNRTLAGVMVDKGIVTASQVDRIKTALEATRGQQIPGYQILAKLGAGAMATVFKARQLSLDRMVAIKVLPRKFSESADYVDRFYKEGKAAAQLNHANIVQAYDVGEAGGFHYFVMEYVEGHTLHDEMAAGKKFTEAEALNVVLQIARALEHAHAQGLIHRDVKPKNVMITNDGVVKLADMGLARETADLAAAQAEAGRAYGTPFYISPEQIRGEVDIDCRADIYSLGATLYHLVTGRVPFDAPTPAGVMHKHLKEPLVPPDHINRELSAGIGEVVETMMAKDRTRRYNTASDLILDLQALQLGEPTLQARKQLSSDVLTGLAKGGVGDASEAEPPVVAAPNPLVPWVIALAVVLAISVVLNIALILRG